MISVKIILLDYKTMPNYILNKLTIVCDNEEVMHTIKKVIITENNQVKEPVTMSRLLPPPDETCDTNWFIEAWGTKWDMFNASIIMNSKSELSMRYDTAWSPNCLWTYALCRYIQSTIDSLVLGEIPKISVEQHFYDDSSWGFAGILTWTPNSEVIIHDYDIMEFMYIYNKPYHDWLVENMKFEPFYPALRSFEKLCERLDRKQF